METDPFSIEKSVFIFKKKLCANGKLSQLIPSKIYADRVLPVQDWRSHQFSGFIEEDVEDPRRGNRSNKKVTFYTRNSITFTFSCSKLELFPFISMKEYLFQI